MEEALHHLLIGFAGLLHGLLDLVLMLEMRPQEVHGEFLVSSIHLTAT
jgi:hypothetical protein